MYCLIMAGGSGTRFWPRSREKRSKQFLNILGNKTLIESTLSRFKTLTSSDNIYIVTKESQREEIFKYIHEIPQDNIIFEPAGKNTAPCIGLGTLIIQQNDPEGIIVVSPGDHQIKGEKLFKKTIDAAVNIAENRDCFVTIGITPNRPATGYGYIQIDGDIGSVNDISAYSVRTFAEKPNYNTAKRFIKSGDFFWNSGIFIFKASVFIKAVEEYLPDLYDGLMLLKKSLADGNFNKKLNNVYRRIKSISIDYGIMEKADNVCLVKGDFDWNDLGSWEQIYELSKKNKNGNAVSGEVILHDVSNSFISSDEFVAVIGLDDIVVVQDNGATIICKRERSEEIKDIVDKLKRRNLKKYL